MKISIVAFLVLAVGSLLAVCQTSTSPQPSAQQTSYEVATVKPWDGKSFGMPLPAYILMAFGMQPSATGQLAGPAWIGKARYTITGKPSDATRDAMKAMTHEQQVEQIHRMQQSLLADRFALKAHIESRVIPVYQLVVAKGGSKLKENTDASKSRLSVGGSQIKGTAMTIRNLVSALLSIPEIDGRTVIDQTGLTATYDFQLDWAPVSAPGSTNGGATSPEAERPSFFTAIEEQLGLKLIAEKAPAKVIVIDHIETPTEN